MPLSNFNSTRDVFRIWFTWKYHAAITFFLIVTLMMLFAYAYTPDYHSKAKIIVLPKTIEGASIITSGINEKIVSNVSTQDINTEIEILMSREVMENTIESFMSEGKGGLGLSLKSSGWSEFIIDTVKKWINETLIFLKLKKRLSRFETNVKALTNSLEVELVAMSDIILVSLKAENPKVAQVVLDRLLKIYVGHHNKVYSKEGGANFFLSRAEVYNEKLKLAEKNFEDFLEKWNIVSIQKQKDFNMELKNGFFVDLSKIDLQIEEYNRSLAFLKKSMEGDSLDILKTRRMQTIPYIVDLERNYVPLLIKRSEVLRNFSPSSKEAKAIEGQISMIRREIIKEVANAIKTDELELDVLIAIKQALQEKISDLDRETGLLVQSETKFKTLKREIELLEKNYLLYSSKTENAYISQELIKQDLSSISIVNKATLPQEATFPKRMLMLILAIILGIFGAAGIPFLLEFLDHTIKTPADVDHFLSLPVISVFQDISNKKRVDIMDNVLDLTKTGQIANLGHRIILLNRKHDFKVFNFISCQKHAGVSTMLINLVKFMSDNKQGINIALISANKYNLFVDKVFNLTSDPGLHDALVDLSGYSKYIHKTALDGISVMPYGAMGDQYMEKNIEQERMTELLTTLKNHFDYIFIDTAPLLYSVEPLLMSIASDLTFIGICANKTNWEVANKSKIYLENNDCAIGGVALNRYQRVIPQWIYRMT